MIFLCLFYSRLYKPVDECVKYVNVSTNVTLLTGIELYSNLWGKNIPFKDFYLNHYCHDNVVIVCALIKTPQQIFTDIFYERTCMQMAYGNLFCNKRLMRYLFTTLEIYNSKHRGRFGLLLV